MGKNHKKIIIAASGAVAMALSLCAHAKLAVRLQLLRKAKPHRIPSP